MYSDKQKKMLNAMVLRQVSTFLFTDYLLKKYGFIKGKLIVQTAKKHEFSR